MEKRKLVTIQKIKDILPLFDSEGLPAESIELVSFENSGWVCVAGRGQFKSGDRCVYFETDSFLPEKPIFDFLKRGGGLRKMFTGEVGYRLKIGKFLGQVSQGLALPVSDIEKQFDTDFNTLSIGEEVTNYLGVIKYEREPVYSVAGDIISDYPSHSSTSGQTRIQNVPEYFEDFKDIEFEETEKFEGTSVSFHFYNGEVTASGHNASYSDNDKFTPWELAHDLGLPAALKTLNRNVTIQGEYMGPKIQGNIENLKVKKFFVYDIWDIDTSKYLPATERYQFIKDLGIPLDHVPVLRTVKIFNQCKSMRDILLVAEGLNTAGRQREGVVYKSLEYINGYVLSFKVISNKYLMKLKD